jgi:signal peptidase I
MFAVVLLCNLICHWVLWPVKVLGDSMCPNYENGSHHYVNKLAYVSEKPKRGDVVTLRVRPGEIFIKRIVGLPGETIECKDGRIVINGKVLLEYYTDTAIPWKMDPVHLAEDHYFVIGDNRAVSLLGPVPLDRILGKVIL